MNQHFALSPDLSIHFQPHGAVLVDRYSMVYYRLSGRGAQLAFLLAKHHDIQKTAQIWRLTTKEEIDADQLKKELSEHPFTVTWTEGFFNRPLMITGSIQSYLPLSCTLQLTNACNLNCSFCYASSGKPYPNELSTSQWLEVMQKLAAHGVSDITLTGGEAKLIKGFKEVMTAASCFFNNVTLFSNGLNWKIDEVELLSHLGNVSVQVSIDGLPKTHDQLRGRNDSFNETMKNVKRLTQSTVPVMIAMTVNPQNAHQVYDVIQACAEANVSIFRVGKTLALGRATDDKSALPKEMENAIKQQLKDAIHKWGDQMVIVDWEEENKTKFNDFCTPGFLSWYIRADGCVTPCQIEDTTIGHILNDSLLKIGDPKNLWQAKCNAKQCKCIKKIEFSEPDLPFGLNQTNGVTI
ncbi:sporulation killing factor system radical SAM maturase [Bacillus changyiensis]|uniref:sporulation killing factor system radical SAM maturase n=1 Tax=Bacillus changyiensis TaxID=3004103 RepID=UPI0022E58A3A|nr:sporulation killing factor system radical SAM maturase [Bacillus changyiensis]MDA1477986.1 sporulation killing factor system radical SAM maturase [Bacillus changyiensis]